MIGLIIIAFIVMLVVVLSKLTSLADKMRTLEWEIARIKAALKQIPEKAESPTVVSSPPPVPATRQSLPVEPQPAISMPSEQRSGPIVKAPPPVQPSRSRTREEWEAFVGGKLLNRIGALALVIGVGFFLKYAFDNNWITESMRVVIGFLSGIGILFGGARSHRKGYEVFAQGLFGAGISILYLSVYASFSFYHLLSQVAAFGLMAGVTVTAFGVAIRYDALSISLLAWAGGFLTPFLLSTRHANEVGLFSYIALLEAGLLAIAMKKPSWVILETLTLLGVYLVFSLWYEQYYHDDMLLTTISFLTIFWGLLYLSDYSKTLRGESSQPELRQVVGIFNVGIYYLFMYITINPHNHEWMGAATLALCLVYLSNVAFTALRQIDAPRILAQNILTATALLVIATAVQFKGFTTVIFWSIEATVLVWCGMRWNYRYVVFSALGLFAISVAKFAATSGAFSYAPLEQFSPIFNYRALTYATLALTFGLSSMILGRDGHGGISWLRPTLHVAWSVVLFVFITVEVNDFFAQQAASLAGSQLAGMEYAEMMTLMCCWTLYSLPLAYAGFRTNSIGVIGSGLMALAVAMMMAFIRGIAFSPIEHFHPVINVRMLAILVVLAGSYLHTIWLRLHIDKHDWGKEVRATLLVASVLLFLWLLTGETKDIFERQAYFLSAGNSVTQVENLEQLSLSGLWLIYGIALMVIGIWRRAKGLRFLAIALLGFSILKIFIYDLSFLQTLYRIFSFMGLGVILLAASYLYQKYKSIIVEVPGKGDE